MLKMMSVNAQVPLEMNVKFHCVLKFPLMFLVFALIMEHAHYQIIVNVQRIGLVRNVTLLSVLDCWQMIQMSVTGMVIALTSICVNVKLVGRIMIVVFHYVMK